MNRRIGIPVVLILLLALAFPTFALETESNSFVLTVDETRARFSLYAKVEGQRATTRVPLFVAADPTSSYFSILSDNRIYRLGESFEFRQTASLTATGAQIVWTSSKLKIQASFDISAQRTAVLDIVITNTSETNLDTGLRALLDTYLGEDSTHYVTPAGSITSETEFNTTIPAYVRSARSDGVGVSLIFDSSGATKPNRIILANWKRLDDTSWSYTVNANRNFNVIPYSINDSAIALYFNPTTIPKGASRTIRLVYSLDAAPAAGGTTVASTSATAGQTTVSGVSTTDAARLAAIRDDLATIQTLLDSIDRILSANREPTDAEIAEIRSAIRTLQEHRSQLEQ